MKRKLLLSILVVAAASSFGQGYIVLDNYFSHGGSGGPLITYGAGIPANGSSGAVGTVGAGLNSSWTAVIYFVVGTPSIFDPASEGVPNALLSLGTGPGSTVRFQSSVGIPAGEFFSGLGFNTGGVAGDMITASHRQSNTDY